MLPVTIAHIHHHPAPSLACFRPGVGEDAFVGLDTVGSVSRPLCSVSGMDNGELCASAGPRSSGFEEGLGSGKQFLSYFQVQRDERNGEESLPGLVGTSSTRGGNNLV